MSEKFFKIVGFGGRTDHESAISVKATIGGENMQMGMEILEITKALHSDCSAGFGIVIGYGLSQILDLC